MGQFGLSRKGCPLIAPLVETEDVRLASMEDIALMKIDGLLSRAMRKDFYDWKQLAGVNIKNDAVTFLYTKSKT